MSKEGNHLAGTGRLGAAIGSEPVSKSWILFFWAASLFNFAIGALGMFSPEATVDARIVSLLVFCFGIIYMLVARDPLRFGPALWAGLIGKLGVVGLLGPAALKPGADAATLPILCVDALFALGFVVFLFVRSDDLSAK